MGLDVNNETIEDSRMIEELEIDIVSQLWDSRQNRDTGESIKS